MGVLNNFLKSITNQIGRDTGRQISREIYGNQRRSVKGLLPTVIKKIFGSNR